MTMTEWACRSLLGLGQTRHLELGGPIPALLEAFKDPKKNLTDLWGHHETEHLYWLIEAKGGDVGLKKLREVWVALFTRTDSTCSRVWRHLPGSMFDGSTLDGAAA
ncbi:hypothetical protein [Streptomyces sp. Amel2xC10]|uniref:hypothetical protein n=1 Tax=Streptomyces sp. Amel2xC10 TaxID=1305826 RepID=UPI000A086453|nr:hypothetical protein [Streptomyces sp. Amel2xC10]SMF86325.1 hypothetical protein SAMN02745830_07155 [Streptomyces sp. Amel2xC10]